MRIILRIPVAVFAALTLLSCGGGAGSNAPSTEVAVPPSAELAVLPDNDVTKNYMGMNTWFLKDWDESFAFVDAMKHARPWRDGAIWNNPVAGIDPLGWPTADASTVIYTGTPAKVNGTYKLVFKGQADVALLFATGAVTNKVYDAASNTTTADVTYNISTQTSVGLVFRNTRRTATSGTNTGFTNARLYRPGYPTDGSVVFAADFVSALRKTSVIRMMDWTATNQNITQGWADRITPLHMSKKMPTYTGPGGGVWGSGAGAQGNSDAGVALEHQIQLCNQVHADCWINIPVVANDDYVRKVALALRYGTDGTNPYTNKQANPVYPALDPDLRIYVEYANEVWNFSSGFYSFGIIQDIVSSLPADHVLTQLAQPGTNATQKIYIYPAYRIASISDVFRSVYGDASMMNRVRPVLMTQLGNANATLSLALNWLDAYAKTQGPTREVKSYVYGAGGSAYYASDSAITSTDRGNADLFFAAGAYPSAQSKKKMALDAVLAGNLGLKRVAYEGGPTLDLYTTAQADAINLDPRMQDMIIKTHDAWSSVGGDLFVYYTVAGPPEWRFTTDIATTNQPKYNGLVQLGNQARAPVTLGQQLPGIIIARDWIDYKIRTGFDFDATCGGLQCVGGNDPGEWIALPGHASNAYRGNLTVNAVAGSGATMKVWINGVSQGIVTLPISSTPEDSTSLSVNIPAGLVVIRLEIVSGVVSLQSIKVPATL